jgi:geranylgeranyl reductase
MLINGNEESMPDIIILGSGPAGAYCASLLGQKPNLTVALIDARSFDGLEKSRKSCGGLLSSHAQSELKKGGLILPDSVKVDPQLTMVDTYDFISGDRCFYPRSYINMDRALFEQWLIDRIPPSVDKIFNTRVTQIEKTDTGFRLTLNKDNKISFLDCKILIGADGADSMVRRLFFTDRPQPDRYVSIQHRYRVEDKHDAYFGFFDERITDYYGWALQKNNELLVGAALRIDGQVHEKFNVMLARIREKTTLSLTQLISTEGSIIVRPRSIRQLNFTRGNVALIGESSGAISPTSAEGFSYALKSARLLAKQLNRYGSDPKALKAYNQACLSIRLSILFKLMKYPGMYHPMIRKWVMKSRITSIRSKKGV